MPGNDTNYFHSLAKTSCVARYNIKAWMSGLLYAWKGGLDIIMSVNNEYNNAQCYTWEAFRK